jgi:hypothetical protein
MECFRFLKFDRAVKEKNSLCKVLFDYTRKMDAGLYVQIITQIHILLRGKPTGD